MNERIRVMDVSCFNISMVNRVSLDDTRGVMTRATIRILAATDREGRGNLPSAR